MANNRNSVPNPAYQNEQNEEEGLVDEEGNPLDPQMRQQNATANPETSNQQQYELTMEECNELLELLYDDDK